MNTSLFSAAGAWMLDLIFPVRCLDCLRFGRTYLCKPCASAVPIRQGFECIGCKTPAPSGFTCAFCAKDWSVDQLLIASDYKNPVVQKALKAFKYRFVRGLAGPLADLTKKFLRQSAQKKKLDVFSASPLLVPVPLARRRENWRGFNQAELLAQDIADSYLMPLAAGTLERKRLSVPQADIEDRGSRLENIRGVFAFTGTHNVSGKTVLLVDDVCTTGATLNECARVLKMNGAVKITALVVARG